MISKNTIVKMEDICKKYPGVDALKNASLSVREGEIKALLGENGAGKSTMIKILTGAETLTSGNIIIDGKKVRNMTPAYSERLGIACVYQNMMLAEHLTVAENIWMGQYPGTMGFLSKKKLYGETNRILEEIGYSGIINPHEKVANLTASQQGMVAIVRAISRNARIVIFDEPTAILADREVEELFRVINLLKERGLAIIYISHRMEEIFRICDTVTVLKDGQYAGDASVSDMTEDDLITMMVGRELTGSNYDPSREIGEEMLRVENLTNEKIEDCSFHLKKGEILGIYGLVGAGRTELTRAVFGADPYTGRIFINGKESRIKSPRNAISRKMSLVPEDRRRQGLALQVSVKHNLNLAVYHTHGRFGFVNTGKEREINDYYIKNIKIKTPSGDQKVKNLSGGNQQKVVLGKWLANDSHIFIMDEPTNGIDVGAKEEIYNLINRLAREGGGVICVSSYMPEVMDICDRILVMRGGKIVTEVQREDYDEEALLALAIKTNNMENEL